MAIKSIYWEGGPSSGCLVILDQTLLPQQEKYLQLEDVAAVWEAIKKLRIRGAPAIGIAAAFGLFLSLRQSQTPNELFAKLSENVQYLGSSRPTAVNLFWALQRMQSYAQNHKTDPLEILLPNLWQQAQQIAQEDQLLCQNIGEHGSKLLPASANILTHCNTGSLATGGQGTALGICYQAHQEGKTIHVYVDETRPLLQGSRLTTWELTKANIPYALICDNMAGFVMRQNKVDVVIVGADRIAANGDTANKIGTYSLAILAHHHKIPFYVAAPSSTFDPELPSGEQIPIEERAAEEIIEIAGVPIAPSNTPVYAPAFDVTPASYITGIITEKGLLQPPYQKSIAELLGRKREVVEKG